MYTSEEIFERFKVVKKLKINGLIYNVKIVDDIVVFKRGRTTIPLSKSDLYKRWTLVDGKLYYLQRNTVTLELNKISAEID